MSGPIRSWPFWLVVLVAGVVSFALAVVLTLAVRAGRRTREPAEPPEVTALRQALAEYITRYGVPPPTTSQDVAASRPATAPSGSAP